MGLAALHSFSWDLKVMQSGWSHLSQTSCHLYGHPIFRGAMTEKRFEILQRNLRFDDAETRLERIKTD
ncbi:hypothetical protein PR048_001204 [Dryococelus australis]|uniref:Uncharacterized protein n=1 Tax=Dryococelus australis TaxID=614101 RepID=A0ABQ9IGP6_9NEOP|nr:hypothetical protein PR048_001204 [Dryococelus australis]